MSTFKDWIGLVLGEDDSSQEALSPQDESLIDVLTRANELGAHHPVWVEFRRRNKTGEFSEEFEKSGVWDGTEENRSRLWDAYLASDEHQKSFREKCLARLQNESLEEGVSADDSDYGIAWTLLVDELTRQGIKGDRGAIADGLVASLRDARPVAVVSNAEIIEYSNETPKIAEAVEKVCDALQEVKIKRYCLDNSIVVSWSYESDKYRCRVPGEDTKWFDNKTAARKYAFSAKKRTDDQPRGYRILDFTRPRGQQQWAGQNNWGPIKPGRGTRKPVKESKLSFDHKRAPFDAQKLANAFGCVVNDDGTTRRMTNDEIDAYCEKRDKERGKGKNLYPHGIKGPPVLSEDVGVDTGMVAVIDPVHLLTRDEFLEAIKDKGPDAMNRSIEKAIKDKFLPDSPVKASDLISVIETRVGDGRFPVKHEGGDIVVKVDRKPIDEAREEVKKSFEITADPETMKVFEAFLAQLHYNGHWGHSGIFGMSFDGDGSSHFNVENKPEGWNAKFKKAISDVTDSHDKHYVELANSVVRKNEES